MSLLYSKLRLQIPQVSDGKNAIITSLRGVNRSVPMTYPITDVFVAGMDKYTVQAGTGSESFSVGNGKLKKIVTEDASALTVASPPTKTTYLVGENLDVSGAVINATIQKGDGTQETRNVASVATYTPPNGTQLNTQGTQRVNVGFADVSAYFDVSVTIRSILKKVPYEYFYEGLAVVYNDEIHIFKSQNHYKWNGTSWTQLPNLPFYVMNGSVVVYDNEIHILGTQNGSGNIHYKWNGTSWTQLPNLPYNFPYGSAVIYNNEIHILGGGGTEANRKNHYKWNGTSWTSVSTIPFEFMSGGAVIFNNEIHILSSTKHYKWNGTSWTSVSTLPYTFSNGACVIFNGQINILGGDTYYNAEKNHYKWNGTSWTSVSTLPYDFYRGSGVVWNSGASDEIIILGSKVSGFYQYDAQWDGTTWTVGSD